ncbi:MAG: hypothetical protein GY924_03165, partial [Planctomycetaceae bacterium]|nr:hypothetical protein [Planctomycetaceae bacterium]
EANVFGDILGPELSSTGTWSFIGVAASDDFDLTLKDGIAFNAGGTLTLDGVEVCITGGVDLSPLNAADLIITGGTTIEVKAGGKLTLTVEQVDDLEDAGIVIFGEGSVCVTGESDSSDADLNTTFGGLQTATVDLSAVTLDAGDTTLEITASGAMSDSALTDLLNSDGDRVAQTIIGSANNDAVTIAATADDGDIDTVDVITRLGADIGDIGEPNSTPTANTPDDATPEVVGDTISTAFADTIRLQVEVDAGFDSLDEIGGWGGALRLGDNIQVAANAEFYSGSVFGDWIATDESTNDGIAVIEADGSVDEILDASAAGGANGWSLIGAPNSAGASNTLIGSAQNDNGTLVDGAADDANNSGEEDSFTGNAGADRFLFNLGTTTPAIFADVENNPAFDEETIDFTAPDGADDGTESVIIDYAIGNLLGSLTVNDITFGGPGVDFTSVIDVGDAVASMLDALGGITAVSDG